MADRYMHPKRLIGVLYECHSYLLLYHPSMAPIFYILMVPLFVVILSLVVPLVMLSFAYPDIYSQPAAAFFRIRLQDQKLPQQRDDRVNVIEHGMVENRWGEQHLDRPEIRAFNNIDHLRVVLNDRARGLDEVGDPVGAAAAYERLLANWPEGCRLSGPIPVPSHPRTH